MTNKTKLLSTFFTMIIVLFMGVVATTTALNKNNMISVYAASGLDVSVALAVANAGNNVATQSNMLQTPNINLGDLTFTGAGREYSIDYTFTINNNSGRNISVSIAQELLETQLTNIVTEYDYELERENQVSKFVNGESIAPADKLIMRVSLYVENAAFDASGTVNLKLNLQ